MSEASTKTRIEARLASLKAEGRAALVTFVTAGDPDLETSRKILLGLPGAGADIIEIGMPFSDPMADGPSIQESSRRALANGHKMADTLQLVRDFRAHDSDTPIVLMGYYNPIYVYPREAFLDDACAAGVDGLIIVDLPPEADDELCIPAGERGINFIRLATPTTDDNRLKTVVTNTSGFVYYISMTGITGDELVQSNIASVHHNVQRIRDAAGLPVAVGFGVRTTEQVRSIAAGADGVVVGSALVDVIKSNISGETINQAGAVAGIHELVRELSRGLGSPIG